MTKQAETFRAVQDSNGRMIRTSSRVLIARRGGAIPGIMTELRQMAWVLTDDGRRLGVNYDDLMVVA